MCSTRFSLKSLFEIDCKRIKTRLNTKPKRRHMDEPNLQLNDANEFVEESAVQDGNHIFVEYSAIRTSPP